MNRPETIEETAELINSAGGHAVPVQIDHLVPEQVQDLVSRIEREQGRLDVLVNDIWGAENLSEWNVPVWKHSLDAGLRMLWLAIDTHIITNHYALGAQSLLWLWTPTSQDGTDSPSQAFNCPRSTASATSMVPNLIAGGTSERPLLR